MSPAIIIGIDEAGNGALAGPLLVAAVAFADGTAPVRTVYESIKGPKELVVGDSKSFTRPEHRDALALRIREDALAFALIERSAKEIDEYLIHNVLADAIRLAASRVVERLAPSFPDPRLFQVLLDGRLYVPHDIPCPVQGITRGDALVWQIGAASILAKTARDARMVHYAEKYPRYGFDRHKGYPVAEHKDRLRLYGPCPIHRETYRPVRALRPETLGVDLD